MKLTLQLVFDQKPDFSANFESLIAAMKEAEFIIRNGSSFTMASIVEDGTEIMYFHRNNLCWEVFDAEEDHMPDSRS